MPRPRIWLPKATAGSVSTASPVLPGRGNIPSLAAVMTWKTSPPTPTACLSLVRHLMMPLLLMATLPACANADYEAAKAAWLARSYGQALQLMMPLARQGDARAQATLALMYAKGLGVDRDPQESLAWYTRAAQAGLPQAQFDLGTKYFLGDGVPRAADKAMYWWRAAADGGLPEAQYDLALAYDRGTGVRRDPELARNGYLKAARQGYSPAQYALGVLYAGGHGITPDLHQALAWFESAAAHDIAPAQYNLGLMYELGRGTQQDVGRAIRWYRRAADLGLARASERLASFGFTEPRTVSRPPLEPTPAPASGSGDNSPRPIHQRPWILRQDPRAFTLQLASGVDEAAIRSLLESLSSLGETAYFKQSSQSGRTRYIALLGVFDTHERASRVLQRLPPSLQQARPWVRRFDKIQRNLLRGD